MVMAVYVRQNPGSWLLSLLLLAILTTAGCSHSVRTFFFTGVPEPGGNEAEVIIVADDENRPFDVPTQTQFTHGPWAAERCESCHQQSSGRRYNAVKADASMSRLVMPITELCVGCHAEDRFTGSGVRWRHGPVANRMCTSCHNPHKAGRQFMLKLEDNQALCGQCHSDTQIHVGRADSEGPAGDCVGCHDPHDGADRMLLRAVRTE